MKKFSSPMKKSFVLALGFVVALAMADGLSAQNCQGTAIGFLPLNDLGDSLYQGYEGGFYPGGSNELPLAHMAAGLNLSAAVEPLDSLGQPDSVNGKYVLLSIGMSNTTQEFREFINLANNDARRNSRLVVVDGAQPGHDAQDISNPANDFWDRIDNQRLPEQGVSPQQVQIVWLKQAKRNPHRVFPADAQFLQSLLLQIVQIVKSRYPNTKLLYLSSRTYAGYATGNLNPEPFAYQSGFAVKWLIEQQLSGDPALNFDPLQGPVLAPWLAWGPYLWTDGVGPDSIEGGVPGRSDGFEWTCSDMDLDGDGFPDGDVNWDGTHPSISGRIKVANLLLDFFSGDTTAKLWYLGDSILTGLPEQDGSPQNFSLAQNYPNPFNPETTIEFALSYASRIMLQVFDVAGRKVKTLIDGNYPAGNHAVKWDGTNDAGQPVASGVYLYRLTVEQAFSLSFVQTRKMVLLR